MLGGVIALVAAIGWGWMQAAHSGEEAPSGTLALGFAGAVLLTGSLMGEAWLRPTGAYPAVLGNGQGGARFSGPLWVDTGNGLGLHDRLVWAAQRDASLDLAPRLPPGRYRVTVRIGGQGRDGGPGLSLWIGPSLVHRSVVEGAAPPAWREREYRVHVDWGGGRLPLRVEIVNVSREEPVRNAYISVIRFDPVLR